MIFHTDVLGTAQKRLLRQLGPVMTKWGFYLGGGSALALRLGHRRSVDLDWFAGEQLGDPLLLARRLQDKGIRFRTEQAVAGTLHGTVSRVRVSLLEYRYPLLKPLVPVRSFGCTLASLEDLAAMKLSAVAQRGAKKDFADIYALGMSQISLQRMLGWYQQKYFVSNLAHLLYSLVFFDDADLERMPQMLWDTNWRTIKETIRQWVNQLAR